MSSHVWNRWLLPIFIIKRKMFRIQKNEWFLSFFLTLPSTYVFSCWFFSNDRSRRFLLFQRLWIHEIASDRSLYLTYVNIGRLSDKYSWPRGLGGSLGGVWCRSMVLSLIGEKYRLIDNARIVNTFICWPPLRVEILISRQFIRLCCEFSFSFFLFSHFFKFLVFRWIEVGWLAILNFSASFFFLSFFFLLIKQRL